MDGIIAEPGMTDFRREDCDGMLKIIVSIDDLEESSLLFYLDSTQVLI